MVRVYNSITCQVKAGASRVQDQCGNWCETPLQNPKSSIKRQQNPPKDVKMLICKIHDLQVFAGECCYPLSFACNTKEKLSVGFGFSKLTFIGNFPSTFETRSYCVAKFSPVSASWELDLKVLLFSSEDVCFVKCRELSYWEHSDIFKASLGGGDSILG